MAAGVDNALLEFYEDFYARGDWKYPDEVVGRKLVASVVDKAQRSCKGTRVLDLGCGTGYYAKFFAEWGAHVVGLDFSMQALRVAAKHISIPLIRADASQLCFAERTFDMIFCSGLSIFNTDDLTHIRKLFSYYRSYLRSGGVFLFLSASDFSGHLSKTSDWMNHCWRDILRFVDGAYLGPFVFHPKIIRMLGSAGFNAIVTATLRTLNVFLPRRQGFLMIVPYPHSSDRD